MHVPMEVTISRLSQNKRKPNVKTYQGTTHIDELWGDKIRYTYLNSHLEDGSNAISRHRFLGSS
jgi:hypothetical protein